MNPICAVYVLVAATVFVALCLVAFDQFKTLTMRVFLAVGAFGVALVWPAMLAIAGLCLLILRAARNERLAGGSAQETSHE